MKGRLIVSLTLVALLMVSCNVGNKFEVKGEIEGADSIKMVYLQQVKQDQIILLDSAKISSGKFKIKSTNPEFAPEFYRVIIGNESVNFSITQKEKLFIKGALKGLSTNYTIEGSEANEKIRQIAVWGSELKGKILGISKLTHEQQMTQEQSNEAIKSEVETYKKKIIGLIMENPASPAAFFGLFQRFYGSVAFNPFEKEDNRIFGAVATSFQLNYPESPRTKYLVTLTLKARQELRADNAAPQQEINLPEAQVVGAFEIELPNIYGKKIKLSDLKGKVVLISFTSYEAKFSPALTITLGELYSKYKERGLEIYQISVDPDETLWKNNAAHLPWITVRDPKAIYSNYLAQYNVQNLPAHYIIDRQGDLIKRIDNPTQIAEIVGGVVK